MEEPERGLLVITKTELPSEHVDDPGVLDHGAGLETGWAVPPAPHPIPRVPLRTVPPEVPQRNVTIP